MRGILTDDNGNLVVRDGHLAIGDNRTQCAQHLIGAHTGEYKHAPLLGGNARKMVSGVADPFWAGEMKGQLKQCHIDTASLRVTGNGVELEINN